MQKESLNTDHVVFNNDPLLFKSYVNKRVTVTTVNNKKYSGIVYTVDPVSESVVLAEKGESGEFNLNIITGPSVKEINVCTDEEGYQIPELFPTKAYELSKSELLKRKQQVEEVLKKNRFPVIDCNGTLKIEEMLTIEPPYRPENCICANEIILSRIQDILSSISS